MTAPAVEDLAGLCVAICLHDEEALAGWAARLQPFARSVELTEALLQCHLFCGFPRTIAGLDALRSHGLHLEAPAGEPDAPSEARGAELFDSIYGGGADGVRAHLSGLQPTFARWVAEHAYGRVLSRPGLGGADRELLAVAMLAATGHDRQLASHARGAVRLGARPGAVAALLERVGPAIPPDRLDRARSVVERFARDEGR